MNFPLDWPYVINNGKLVMKKDFPKIFNQKNFEKVFGRSVLRNV